jgi:DNA-binding transcriptional MerR regulator
MGSFTIGQVAERSGFTPAALRYYDDKGLVTPESRSDGGYRLYGDDALERLAFIARAKQLGCSLDEVADLLTIWDGDRCAPVQARFHELVTDKIHATQAQIAELLAFAAQLQAAAGRLAAPATDDPCGVGCACLTPDEDHATFAVELGPTGMESPSKSARPTMPATSSTPCSA